MGRSTFSGPVRSNAGFEASTSSTTITEVLRGTVSVDIPSLATTVSADVSVTIAGAVAGDSVVMNPPTAGLTAGLQIEGAWVSAANTVDVRIRNSSGGTIDEAAGTWSFYITRS